MAGPSQARRRRLALYGWCAILGVCGWGGPRLEAVPASPPVREYIRRAWTREQGLPDNEVHAIAQTRDGYLWVATGRGLARFDGLRFTVFDHLNTPEMKNELCLHLAEDAAGDLWIGTSDGLLRRSGNTFRRFAKEDGLCGGHIAALCASAQGDVWIGCDGGLNRFAQGHLVKFPRLSVPRYVGALCADSAGRIWIGTETLDCFNPGRGTFETMALPRERSDCGIVDLQPDGEEGLWVLLLCHGGKASMLYRFQDGRWELPPGSKELPTTPEPWNLFLATDRTSTVWLAAGLSDLLSVHQGHWTSWAVGEAMADQKSGTVFCAHEDREGSLWLGTRRGGLMRWQPKKLETLSTGHGLAHDNTWALCEDRDGSVWIGTDGGLSHFQPGRTLNYTERDGLSGNTVRALALDANGTLWVGTGKGLNSWRDGKMNSHPFPGEWFEGRRARFSRTGTARSGLAPLSGSTACGQRGRTSSPLPMVCPRTMFAPCSRIIWVRCGSGQWKEGFAG